MHWRSVDLKELLVFICSSRSIVVVIVGQDSLSCR